MVIHYTAMGSASEAIDRLCDPQAAVSAHFVISRTGEITQLVDEDLRAWHAGAGEWHGLTDINSRSVGIELDNGGDHPFPEPQMASLEWLLPQILRRWGIPPEGVIGHSDMAPGRKTDPGPHFDWTRLARRNLAAAAPPRGCTARAAGYTAEAEDADIAQSIRLRWGAQGAQLL